MNRIYVIAISAILAQPANGQTKALLKSDYSAAAKWLSFNTRQYVDHDQVDANWFGADKFWYRNLTATGSEFILVDAEKGSRSAAFDQQKLADALSKANEKKYLSEKLPFREFSFGDDGHSIRFKAAGKDWNADLGTYVVAPLSGGKTGPENLIIPEVLSPDGKKAAFIKNYNLWIRQTASGQLTQLTTDGVQYFGYATDNAGWKHSDQPILRWSPDSRKIATFQQDERLAGDMYLVSTNVGHPKLMSWKYPLPGDSNIITIQRVIIDLDKQQVIRLQLGADPHRASLSDDISSGGTFDDVDWNADASQLAFVSTSRDHKIEKFRIADATTGAVREVFEELSPTQYESGQGTINWRWLAKTNEVIWYSERDDWGHLYLYDALTGKLRNQITKGSWLVTEVLKVDEKSRLIYFLSDGQDPINPYFTHFYKVGFDGKNLTDLTPESGNHRVKLSPSEKYFVDDYSQPDLPNTIVLRNMDGKLILPLEKADISRLLASGWQAPKPFKVKADDKQTDLYGLLFTPPLLEPGKKYPVIVYIYPGPQGGSIGSWSFHASRGDNAALANLGFIVVAIEGSSNPLRSKTFHDMAYGNMAVNTLPDQIAGLRQLAGRYSYIDTSRIGIWGHSGGGFATACAMFNYPDFFSVGIAESGNHDNRNYEDDWGERYIGLLAKDGKSGSNYEWQANQVHASQLKGKLLLAHGLMDDNVPPSNTMLVIDALEKANKDYDLIVFPNAHHGYGQSSYYMMRRRWDYFVQHLLGAEPPKEFDLKPMQDPRNFIEQ